MMETEDVFVVYQNKFIVGIFSTKRKATTAINKIDMGTALERDAFFSGPLEVSMKQYKLDQVYPPHAYPKTTVKADKIKRQYRKRKDKPEK
jgi:hypothetical protein